MEQPTALPAADEAIVTIPWDQLHDSPLQYRQTYSQATIDEIAATIVDTGRIHQALVVRLRYPNPLFRDRYDPQDGYEIVFGHTRKRAGMQAGLTGGPCVVRVMNDAQVRAAQAAENIARADVHPIEEAQGFRTIIDEDGITADELATQLGKSRSYVYGRLKLLALCPEVRKAVMAGDIGTEVGLLIARVGNAKMQGKALGYIKGKAYDLEDGGKRSFRNIRDLLNERFTLDLKSAIFDVDDEMLVPSAGYCGRCPKRSGNAPEFVDIAQGDKPGQWSRLKTGADICTDPDCFDAKKKAHLAREAGKLAAQGKVVVSGNKARAAMTATGALRGPYIEVSRVRDALKQAKATAAATGAEAPPQVVIVQDQRTGKTIQAVLRHELTSLGAKVPEAPVARSYGETPEQAAQRIAARAADERKLEAINGQRRALLDQVRAAMRTTPRTAHDLMLVATAAYRGVSWESKALMGELWGFDGDKADDDDVQARVRKLELPDLTQFIMDCSLVDNVRLGYLFHADREPEALIEAAKAYGISPTTKSADPTPTPSTAAQATKGAAGKAKKTKGAKATEAALREPELPLDHDQTDDAGSAGGSDATAAAQSTAARAPGDAAGASRKVSDHANAVDQTDDAGSAGGSDARADALEVAP